jgi:hypothetical protein
MSIQAHYPITNPPHLGTTALLLFPVFSLLNAVAVLYCGPPLPKATRVDGPQESATREVKNTPAKVSPEPRKVVVVGASWLSQRGSGPYYLDKRDTSYILDTNVATKTTAFVLTADNITFDLNGHTITYDNAPAIVVPNGSFEQGSGNLAAGWDTSNAPNAFRFRGQYLLNQVYEGDYCLRFTVPARDQFVTSTFTLTLEAKTAYSLSAMIEFGGMNFTNPGVTTYVRLVGEGLPIREVSWDSTNWRGMQLCAGEFTTGPSRETYHLVVGIKGAGTAPSTGIYVDDIKIQRTKVYGIAVGAPSWEAQYYPDVAQYNLSRNSTIKNGTIVQGVDNGTLAHGVRVANGNGTCIDTLNITVRGADCSTIYWDYGLTSTIRNCTLTSNVTTISNRDHFDGVMVGPNFSGSFHNNRLLNGPHAGILTARTAPSDIHDNVFRLKTKYTNAFCILLGGPGSRAFSNLIDCASMDYSGRGINPIGDPERKQMVYKNVIRVRLLANNQEYQGRQLGGAYGIRVKEARNVEIYENDVLATASDVDADCFRANEHPRDVYVHDNTFRAVRANRNVSAGCLKLGQLRSGSMVFEDNTLITNDRWATCLDVRNVTLTRSRLAQQGDPVGGNLIVSDSTEKADATLSLFWKDNIYTTESARALMESSGFNSPTGKGDDNSSFTVAWTTTIKVEDSLGSPVERSRVIVSDGKGSEAFVGKTGKNGRLTAVLGQFTVTGSGRANRGYYELRAEVSNDVQSQSFLADKVQTVVAQQDKRER